MENTTSKFAASNGSVPPSTFTPRIRSDRPARFDALLHSLDQRGIDVDADHRARAEPGDEQLVDGAQAAADIQDLAAADIAALEEAFQLIAAPGRQKSVAP